MSDDTQNNRNIAIDTPLGENVLLLDRCLGVEELGRLSHFDMDLSSSNQQIDYDSIVGKKVTIRAGSATEEPRYFHGFINHFVQVESTTDLACYRATMVPWLWFHTRISDCRIFQANLTVPQIIEMLFKERNFGEYRNALSGTYRQWEYCVQYRETDFNFISRLMEQEGIYYYFEHTKEKHVLVLCDFKTSHQPVEGEATIPYHAKGAENKDAIFRWQMDQEFAAGAYMLRDFDFKVPKKGMDALELSQQNIDSKYQIYDYPGEYVEQKDGMQYATVRQNEQAAPYQIGRGRTNALRMATGALFTLTSSSPFPRKNQLCEYLVTYCEYLMVSNAFNSVTGVTLSEPPFTCRFKAMPTTRNFRPERLSPKPLIQGPQTAIVTGPKGKEIYTDKYGRVKVQFHWDRLGKNDENSSCFIRVAQIWAGKRWGASFWPRIGQEVIVEFQEGDPDEPIITGSVYNGDEMPPYLGDGPDPKHKNDPNVSGVKSCSTLGGKGYNEWRFDDTKGKEEIFIHAQKNLDERVNADSMETIGNDRHLNIGGKKVVDGVVKRSGDQREQIFRDKFLTIHRLHEEWIGDSMSLHVGGIDDGEGIQDVYLEGQRRVLIGTSGKFPKTDHLHVVGDRAQHIEGNTSLTVDKDQQEKVGGNHLVEATGEIHLKAGTNLTLEAGEQLTIKVGGNFVVINSTGVSIVGTLVNINSGGSAGSGTDSQPASPDDPTNIHLVPKTPVLADNSVTGYVSNTSGGASSGGSSSGGGGPGGGGSGGGASGAAGSGGDGSDAGSPGAGGDAAGGIGADAGSSAGI